MGKIYISDITRMPVLVLTRTLCTLMLNTCCILHEPELTSCKGLSLHDRENECSVPLKSRRCGKHQCPISQRFHLYHTNKQHVRNPCISLQPLPILSSYMYIIRLEIIITIIIIILPSLVDHDQTVCFMLRWDINIFVF